ncbi:MAG: efflux transporter outer membrane subunit [Ignavibacteria bacterium]|nr:efflux transporter outer membrane subunit [Ignavibacteria bacterium]
MKKRKIQIIYIVFALLIFSGCKTLNTNLTIPEKKIPASFSSASTDTTNIAEINWRQYFADTLLVKLIDTALAGNIDLQMALQRIEAARASVKLANGALLPQVGLNINGGVRKFGLYTMDGAGNITTEITPGQIVPINLPDMYVGLNASWEIDIWGKLRNQSKSAFANYLSSIEGTNFVISNLIADVTISYYELIALDNEQEIIRQTIQKQQEALEVIKLQKETGRANELVVQQFQAQLLNSQALEFETKQQILEQENLINFLLGRYPQAVQRNKEVLFQEMPQQFASGIPSQLLSNRPDIREAEFQVQASKFDLKAAREAFFPNLNITAGLGFQAFNPEFLFTSPASLAYSVLGGLVAPLVNMNALKAQFNTAKASQLSAMYNYQKTILNGYVEVANELSNIENLKKINTLKKQQSDVLIQSVETSTELYKTAKANYLEVLIAQQNSLQTQFELISVNKRQRIATVNIYKALGGGWK